MPATEVTAARFLGIKALAARIMTADIVGWCIRCFSQGSIRRDGVVIHAEGISHRNIASIYWGLYESAELRFVRMYLRSELDTIELGSSLGVVSSYAGRRLAPGTRLICVEANPELLPLIRRNLARNAPHVQFKVLGAAVHYGSPTIRFSIGRTNLSSRVADDTLSPQERAFEVPTISLGEVLSDLGPGWFQLICDIEGAEVGLLANDVRSLDKCALLIMETHEVSGEKGRYGTDDIIALIVNGSPLRLKERYGPVCVFLNPNFASNDDTKGKPSPR